MPQKKRKYAEYPPLAAFRYRLGEHDPLLALAFIGIISGLASGLMIAAFLLGIEALTSWVTTSSASILANTPDFESISAERRALTVLIGCAGLGLLYQLISPKHRYTGLNHTLVRVHKNNGRFSPLNLLVQFFGGIIALGTGASGGREGPGIHLGAGVTSVLAQRYNLPHNSLRIAAACGAAGAIGASFNTPIAGVIFAMEVIIMEYTLIGFIPVILSAVTATLISHAFFGNQSVFEIADMQLNSLLEIPFLAFIGLACGCASVLFIRVQQFSQPLLKLPVSVRFGLVGIITAIVGLMLPQIMGMGYDTVNQTLSSSTVWQTLLIICLMKIIVTAFSSAMGMPIGIIGPALFIGVLLGSAIGQIGAELVPQYASSPAFYGLLAMCGVMGSLLNAPLAATIAVMELTRNTDALLPGILVIVIANLCSTLIFGQRSANQALLESQGISLDTHPVAQALNRLGLSAIIDRNVRLLPEILSQEILEESLAEEARTVVIQHDSLDKNGRQKTFYYTLTRKQFQQLLSQDGTSMISDSTSLVRALKNSNIEPQELLEVNVELTVEQARQLLFNNECAGLWVNDPKGPLQGVLKRETLPRLIENW